MYINSQTSGSFLDSRSQTATVYHNAHDWTPAQSYCHDRHDYLLELLRKTKSALSFKLSGSLSGLQWRYIFYSGVNETRRSRYASWHAKIMELCPLPVVQLFVVPLLYPFSPCFPHRYLFLSTHLLARPQMPVRCIIVRLRSASTGAGAGIPNDSALASVCACTPRMPEPRLRIALKLPMTAVRVMLPRPEC
jgi:hypothetical protein